MDSEGLACGKKRHSDQAVFSIVATPDQPLSLSHLSLLSAPTFHPLDPDVQPPARSNKRHGDADGGTMEKEEEKKKKEEKSQNENEKEVAMAQRGKMQHMIRT